MSQDTQDKPPSTGQVSAQTRSQRAYNYSEMVASERQGSRQETLGLQLSKPFTADDDVSDFELEPQVRAISQRRCNWI